MLNNVAKESVRHTTKGSNDLKKQNCWPQCYILISYPQKYQRNMDEWRGNKMLCDYWHFQRSFGNVHLTTKSLPVYLN